jgi:hypothetical protein
MNPFNLITHPIGNVAQAVFMPVKAVFVVGLCALINAMTSPGHWWFQWVALGMGIAVLVAWGRALKSVASVALVGALGWWLYRRYGDDARRHFDQWAERTRPTVAQALTSAATGGPRRDADPGNGGDTQGHAA